MSGELNLRGRVFAAVLAVGIIAILVVARRLQPDPRGLGTHQQLGLPACHFYEYTGIPCPQCGMTTSFTHLVRGHWQSAWRVHPCGPLLAGLLTGVVLPWCVLAVVTGRSMGTQRPGWCGLILVTAYGLIAVAIWIARV